MSWKYKHNGKKSIKGITRSWEAFLKKSDVADDRYVGTFRSCTESKSDTLKSFYIDVEGEFCQVSEANLTRNEGYAGRTVRMDPVVDSSGYAVPSGITGSMMNVLTVSAL
jgi:hypothetical protein